MDYYFELAKKARLNAHDPYSNYLVGSCLVTKDGKTYTGCNISDQGILSICSERVAFLKALSEGEKFFKEIYIVGGPKDEDPKQECLPCGYCRQFMSEFVNKDFKIYTVDNVYTMEDLLPNSFDL